MKKNKLDQQQIYQQLAESLANLFAPLAEVALLDAEDGVISVFNRLTHDKIANLSAKQPTVLFINKMRQAKALKIPLEAGYALRLIVEVTFFEALQTFLNQFLIAQEKTTDAFNWQQLVEQTIADYLQTQQTCLSALSAAEKRALILLIQEKDLFRYQEASKYLASKLNVSRATIYNYLKQASQFKLIEVHQVDAFTDEPFSGNPAGVVLEADTLSDIMMKKIAREMNLSETSFLFTSKKADFKLRYFTPIGAEVKFCGHSTVGALYMLAHKKMLGMNKPGRYTFNLETQLGILPVTISLKTDKSITIQFATPKIMLVPSKITHTELAQALGIPLEVINLDKPIMYEKNNQDLYVTITRLKQLGELHIDHKSAKQFAEKHQIVAFALLCPETIAAGNHIHMRCFAPAVGIPEDPFTGSVLGGLSAYITQNHLLDKNISLIRVEQGHFMSRPGFVDMQLDNSKTNASPLIIAKARHFFSTQINL
ncbi:MAG TPA: PhzF family phenazine biosynthesis isomerase [Gammaproteobacteria bacterium]|jgi:PhzF family phenazine biosynthesis protein|nr:PhzF family phenazine biosynthesis isomerase [Gammaproteobacteria bacterium]